MKKYAAFLLALLCLCMLCACKEEEVAEEFSFQATVLEVHEGFLLVEPAEGAWERNSVDRIVVSFADKTSWPIPQVGDTVNVFYNGELMETYPAQISKLYRVEILP